MPKPRPPLQISNGLSLTKTDSVCQTQRLNGEGGDFEIIIILTAKYPLYEPNGYETRAFLSCLKPALRGQTIKTSPNQFLSESARVKSILAMKRREWSFERLKKKFLGELRAFFYKNNKA